MNFCCEEMTKRTLEFKCKEKSSHNVIYDKQWRQYVIYYKRYDERDKIKRAREYCSEIHYCPWCGSKLPKELSDEWFEVLEQEYGIVSPQNHDRKKVPPEFKTDEWWKKRGL